MPITDTKAKKAKPETKVYKILDSEGLYLEVRPTGKKFWRYRFYINKKEGLFTIGEYPFVTLSEARKERDWAKQQAKQGLNPNQVRKQQLLEEQSSRNYTFRSLALEYRSRKEKDWSASYLKQFDQLMENDIFPVVGGMAIQDIKPINVLRILDVVIGRKAPSIAAICRMHMSKVFRLAAGKLLVESDPTHLLADAIPKRKEKHFTPIPISMIPDLLNELDGYGGRRTALGVRLLLHTFMRGAELRQASWQEIDFKRKLWTVPAEHTKKRRIHLVPLSHQALDILKELESMYGSEPEAFIFPKLSDPTKCMAKRSMDAALEYMGFRGKFSLHGFRSAASTTLNEYGWHTDAIEKQLAHMEQKSERRAYNHAQYLEIRTEMMQWWSNHIESVS